jgi:hypothetical protein
MKYPDGMEEYIRSIAWGRTRDEVAKLVSERFGIEFTPSQCTAYKKNHNIVSGVDCKFKKGQTAHNKGKPVSKETYEKLKPTMFKPGSVPANHMEVGTIVPTKDGYLRQKVRETGKRFELLHRIVWEQHNGPIPKGKVVTFLDGNKENCSIENLMLIDRAEELELNRRKLRTSNPERTKAGVMVAKLRITARKKRRTTHE